ncbi:MobF family relaxase [Sporichthya brevicatena]|uniref:MobF family relaxase n=1 Tax=Sporichthya brevicatena TaxID=171442 RepID=A0ABP3SHP2_9ACTN
MLSSAKIGTSSWGYYTAGVACAATDYYIGAGEAPGRWSGRGVAALGLEPGARVSEAQLEALFARALHSVTGQRLGRAWRHDAVTGFDLTFSAPKSVSSLWALGDRAMAGEVRAAHRAAVDAALSYLDTHASFSRRGVDGVKQVATAGLAAALFEHRTSRCGDPQLHTHALVVNKVFCADGRWRTLDATELYHHKKSAGTVYQAALRSELHSRLGVVFDAPNAHGQAEISGIPAGLLKLWSKRTAQIEPEAAAKIAQYEKSLGRSLTAGERVAVTKTAVLKTRPGKTHPDPGTLHETWAAEAERAGHRPPEVLAQVRAAAVAHPATQPLAPGDAAAQAAHAVMGAVMDAVTVDAVAAAAGARSTFSRADVVAQVAARLPVDARGADAVLSAVETLTDQALGLDAAVPVGRRSQGVTPRASDARWAGADVLASEERILDLARRGRAGGYGRVHDAAVAAALTTAAAGTASHAGHPAGPGAGLDAGQRAAVQALTVGGDFLSVLTAPAGAGKTATLGAAARAWAAAGYRVIGLAPSARAAAELAAATGGVADTLAKWRVNHQRRAILTGDLRERTVLNPTSVVILDEASMASTVDLDELISAAAVGAAKVVLVGDPAQIGVINGPGGMLAALARAGHGHELGTVHRFHHKWEATASLALRAGDPTALRTYRDQQRLHPCPDADTALTAVHDHWVRERGTRPPAERGAEQAVEQASDQPVGTGALAGQPGAQTGDPTDEHAGGHSSPDTSTTPAREVLMMARTRADVDALNALARATAQAGGEVHGPAVRIGERDWQTGDVLRTRRNDRTLPVTGDHDHDRPQARGHVRNGDRWRVLHTDDAGLLVEHLDRGGRAFLPAAYVAAHAEYGWATTITAAQGATVDVGLVLVRPGIDREHLYVALTRGRQANHAYITPDPTTDPEHHGPGHVPGHGPGRGLSPVAVGAREARLEQRAHEVLATALARTGGQDAASVVRDRARELALREQYARFAEADRRAEQPVTSAEHAARADLLAHKQTQREELARAQQRQRHVLDEARDELARTPAWRRGRQRTLTETITTGRAAVNQTWSDWGTLDREISVLSRRVEADTRQRNIDNQARAIAARRASRDRPDGSLTAAPSEEWREAMREALRETTRREPGTRTRRASELQDASARRHRDRGLGWDHGPTRGDGPGVGR